jgi:hypothetical protein
MDSTICKKCNKEFEFDDDNFFSVDYECPYCGKIFRYDGYCGIIFLVSFFVLVAGVWIYEEFVDKSVDKNEISEIEGGEEKNNSYLYEDGFFVSYQKKYDTVWAMCKMMGPRKIGTLKLEYSTRSAYEELTKDHYSPPKPTNDVWIARLKNSIRNMKPDSSEQQQHTAIVDLANTFIAADDLLNSDVSASTFLYKLNSIEKNYVEALRKVELNISPE